MAVTMCVYGVCVLSLQYRRMNRWVGTTYPTCRQHRRLISFRQVTGTIRSPVGVLHAHTTSTGLPVRRWIVTAEGLHRIRATSGQLLNGRQTVDQRGQQIVQLRSTKRRPRIDKGVGVNHGQASSTLPGRWAAGGIPRSIATIVEIHRVTQMDTLPMRWFTLDQTGLNRIHLMVNANIGLLHIVNWRIPLEQGADTIVDHKASVQAWSGATMLWQVGGEVHRVRTLARGRPVEAANVTTRPINRRPSASATARRHCLDRRLPMTEMTEPS